MNRRKLKHRDSEDPSYNLMPSDPSDPSDPNPTSESARYIRDLWIAIAVIVFCCFVGALIGGCSYQVPDRRSCGQASCGDGFDPSTVAKCLADSFVECTPATGILHVGAKTLTYQIDGCGIQYGDGHILRTCRRLILNPLIQQDACPWISLEECGPDLVIGK